MLRSLVGSEMCIRDRDYDLGRIRTCGELKRYGVYVHPDAPMSYLCADVIYEPPGE